MISNVLSQTNPSQLGRYPSGINYPFQQNQQQSNIMNNYPIQGHQEHYVHQPSAMVQMQLVNRKMTGYAFQSDRGRAENIQQMNNFKESNATEQKTFQSSAINDYQKPRDSAAEVSAQGSNYQNVFKNEFYTKNQEIMPQPKQQKMIDYQNYFSHYAKGDTAPQQKQEDPPLKQKPKSSGIYMSNYYQSMVEPAKIDHQKQSKSFIYEQKSEELENYKKKVSQLTKQLTRLSVDKSDLIVELAEISRQNHNLKKEIQSLKQELITKTESLVQVKVQKEEPKGIFIDYELLNQIEAIKEREMEIGKIKKEFLSILEMKYQEEMKRLSDLNGVLKLELHNAKFELSLSKEASKQKQMKIDLMQKQMEALESTSSNQSRAIREKVELQVNEKNKEIDQLKYTLVSLEAQYKAKKREIADRDDFIRKFMAGQSGQDSEVIQLLIDKYNFYSKQQFQAQTSEQQ